MFNNVASWQYVCKTAKHILNKQFIMWIELVSYYLINCIKTKYIGGEGEEREVKI